MLFNTVVADILLLSAIYTSVFSDKGYVWLSLYPPYPPTAAVYNKSSCHNWSVVVAQDRIGIALPPSSDLPGKYMLSLFMSFPKSLSHVYTWLGCLNKNMTTTAKTSAPAATSMTTLVRVPSTPHPYKSFNTISLLDAHAI